MTIAIRTSDGVSMHHRLSTILRSHILAGQFSQGSSLPGEHRLMTQYDVSRATVRRALLTLEQEGLVERRQGRPTIVTFDPTVPRPAAAHGRRPSAEKIYAGTAVELLEHGPAFPTEDCRRALKLPAGAKVYRIKRLRWRNDEPLWCVVSSLPMSLKDRLAPEDVERAGLITTLEHLGSRVTHSEERLGAILADAIVAPLLHVEVGAPLLQLNRTLMEGERAPIAFQTLLVPPNRQPLVFRVKADGRAVRKPFRNPGLSTALNDA